MKKLFPKIYYCINKIKINRKKIKDLFNENHKLIDEYNGYNIEDLDNKLNNNYKLIDSINDETYIILDALAFRITFIGVVIIFLIRIIK